MWSLHVPLRIQRKLIALEARLNHLMGTDVLAIFFALCSTALLQPKPLPGRSSEIILRHTTLSRTPLVQGFDSRTNLYLTTH